MNTNLNDLVNRRNFLLKTSSAFAGIVIAHNSFGSPLFNGNPKPSSKIRGVQLGVITYSFRSMPGSATQLLQYCLDANINAIELIGDAVEEFAGKPINPLKFTYGQQITDEQKQQLDAYKLHVAQWRADVTMEKFKVFRKLYNNAGVSIYAFKPRTCLEPSNTDAEIEYAMKAAKTLGASSVTVELPTESAHAKRLGDIGAKYNIYIGYHAHTQATDTAWDEALVQSPYNSLNLDCGHYIAAGGNNTKESLLALIEKKAGKITSLHLKDRKSKINGETNMPWGEGDTPIKEILTLVKDKKYKFPLTIELEYDIPTGSDAVKEVTKCFEFCKKILLS